MGYNLRSRKPGEKRIKEIPSPFSSKEEDDLMLDSDPRGRALRNEYILAAILGYLPMEDLKECRYVNRVWCQVATHVLAPKAPVIKLEKGIDCVKRLLKTMRTSKDFPWKKFAFKDDILEFAQPKDSLLLSNLFENIVASVLYLKISTDSKLLFPQRKPKENIEFSKLKCLDLELCSTCSVSANVDFMINILHHSPKLDNFSLNFETFHSFYGHDDVTHLLRLMMNVPWNNLSHLKLYGNMKEDYFKKIVEMGTGMKLKTFDMVCSAFGSIDELPPGSSFRRFLDHQSGSLEALNLTCASFSGTQSEFSCPAFPELNNMEIQCVITDKEGDQTWNLLAVPSFFQKFPVLLSITIVGVDWSVLPRFLRSEDKNPVDTVKTLKVDTNISSLDEEEENANGRTRLVVTHLTQMFPRVKNLAIPAHRAIMRAIEIEEAWNDLQALTLLCGKRGEHVNSALTGLSPRDCARTFKNGKWIYRYEHNKMATEDFKFLQKIQTVKLDADRRCININNSFFSDMSCRLVLLKMNNLKVLDFRSIQQRLGHHVREEVICEMRAKFTVMHKKEKSAAE